MIDWTAETWGQAGHNAHEASNGSWIDCEERAEQ